jgi:hypothetical protein
LRLTLDDAGGGAGKLGYVIDDNIIRISTIEDLNILKKNDPSIRSHLAPTPSPGSPAPAPFEDDWPLINIVRFNPTTRAMVKEGDQAVEAELERLMPEFKTSDYGLSNMIAFLGDLTGTNIVVNWPALEAVGVTKETPITARLKDVTISKALELILDNAAGGPGKLGYVIDGGVIRISTADDLKKNPTKRDGPAMPTGK